MLTVETIGRARREYYRGKSIKQSKMANFILRTPVTGVAGKVFQAVGIPLPPNIREADPLPSAA
jgi:hypothetical protein